MKLFQENWQHSSGQPVTRTDLLMTLANLESINIRTIYNNRMASVGLSDIIMDTSIAAFTLEGLARDVEECRSLFHLHTHTQAFSLLSGLTANASVHKYKSNPSLYYRKQKEKFSSSIFEDFWSPPR